MNFFSKFYRRLTRQSVWARPNMPVTFRAEIMPGRSREERTYLIEKVLPNGRVTLEGVAGEHRDTAFEPVSFERKKDQNS